MPIASIYDYRPLAQKRIPKFAFDYMDGAAGTEIGAARNVQAFEDLMIMPRMLMNVEKIDTSTTLFGKKWAMPFGTAPIGLGNLMWPRAEETIAKTCVEAGIPYTISTPACTSLEKIKEVAPHNAWFQLYVGRAEEMVADLVTRAETAGYDTMLVTVDVPIPPRRERDIRNNFSMHFRWSPSVMWQLMTHPAWSIQTLRSGIPRFANMERYSSGNGFMPTARFMSSQVTGRFDWAELKKLRDRWKGKLLPKGLLSVEDCVKAKEIGCDGVVVSNHGGRQLGALPPSIDVIGDIRAAVGKDYPLILDSGIRSGEHIVKALASGADFCLIGRAMMYSVAALGLKGPKTTLDLLTTQINQCLGQIGYPDIDSLKKAAPVIRKK